MIREICKDETFLAQKAAPATAADLGVAQDLMETLIAHKDGCVGMAANMIGVNKRIIAFENDGEYIWSCSTLSSSNSPEPMKRTKAAYRLPARGKPSATKSSKCSGRIKNSRRGLKRLPAGRRKSSSTKLTTVREF